MEKMMLEGGDPDARSCLLDDNRGHCKMAANLKCHQTTRVTSQPSEKDHELSFCPLIERT